jgi:hypothetical protein
MTEEELQNVRDTVEGEGFDYAFMNYSDFSEIEDEEFHKLREAYVDATRALAEYIGVDV